MTDRENFIRTVRFQGPERIPVIFCISGACWHHYPPEQIKDLMASHPMLFPSFKEQEANLPPSSRAWPHAGEPFTDEWGCTWETTDDGIVGAVVKHPLATWDALDIYEPPSPAGTEGAGGRDWDRAARDMAAARERGELLRGGLAHGHTYLRLLYIRGYENLTYDMADDDPRLHRLIDMVEEFNAGVVSRYLDLGVEMMSYPEDLGMQVGPMLSPEHFRKYMKPVYQRLIEPARQAGCMIHMHSDGDIRDLVWDLIDGGVEIVNLQDLVNGIDWIRGNLKGRVCIDLDVDRQKVVRFGTPQQVDALIRESVEKLGSPEGGLLFTHGWYPGVPIENAAALMDALEKYATYYS